MKTPLERVMVEDGVVGVANGLSLNGTSIL